MNLSALTLQKLVRELHPLVTRRLIRDAFLVGQRDLYLDLGESGRLLLSAFPGKGRALFAKPPEALQHTRTSWLDRYVYQAGIVALSQIPNERVIQFDIEKRDRLGSASQCRLICELIGRYSNVILVDTASGNILGALRPVSARQNRMREILPGRRYEPPPALGRTPPDAVVPDMLSQAFAQSDTSPDVALARRLMGLDAFTARELLFRAGIDGTPHSAQLPRLCDTIRAFFKTPPFLSGAAIATDAEGAKTICVFQPQHAHIQHPCASVSEAIHLLMREETQGETLQTRRKNIARDLREALTAAQRKTERIRTDLSEADQADLYEKYGNILIANIPRIPPGAARVVLPDLFLSSAPEIPIPLNPERTPAENAQDYLKRGRKARKGAPILALRLEASKKEEAKIQRFLDRLETLKEEDIKNFHTDLAQAGLAKPPKQKPQTDKRGDADIHPRRYRTSDGWTVLVGRNNKENDKLTKNAARDDLFFHVQGCPGSHVILKREGKADNPSKGALKEAASLAAYWSKARGAKTASVNYTEVRYVQKPRGAPPGQVTIRNEKSIMAQPREIQRADES